MKKLRLIPRRKIEPDLPFVETVVSILALDRIHAPGWAWGVIGTLMLLSWIMVIVIWFTDEEISLP